MCSHVPVRGEKIASRCGRHGVSDKVLVDRALVDQMLNSVEGFAEVRDRIRKEVLQEVRAKTQPFNQLTCAEAERLALLSEELGEAQQAVGKILRHGYESVHPSPIAKDACTNRAKLEKELGDVLVAIQLMQYGNDVRRFIIDENKDEKLKRVREWLHHQEG